MIVAHHIPKAPLAAFIKLFWYWDGYSQPHARERLLPDGSVTLVFNLRQDHIDFFDSADLSVSQTTRGHVITGARSRCFIVDTASMVATLGVQFHPGGAFPFCTMPVTELSEQHVSLDDLWGDTANDVRYRLLEPTTPQEKFRVVEQWLLDRLAKPLERHPAVEYAMSEFLCHRSALPVSTIAERIGFSQRRFIQLFSDRVGLTPKRFSRIRRFQWVLEQLRGKRDVDWTDLALACGYYDQAHFIHDFHEFSGLTPSAYLASQTPHLNHVPVAR
jgi:AraC-like DNA-binding protein